MALPGIVDVESGRLLSAPNLGWEDVVPGAALEAALGGLPLRIGNEADLAAHAYAHPAPGRDSRPQDFVYLSGEVGIGGAVVVDGDGHERPPRLGRGDRPRLRRPGRTPLPLWLHRLPRAVCRQARHARAAGLDASTTPSELAARTRDGDEKARAATRSAARALGVALAGVVNVLDIPTVVLGGHLAQVGDLLTPEVEEILGRRVLAGRWVSPRVVIASDDPAPGATGAALLALDELVRDPAGVLGH